MHAEAITYRAIEREVAQKVWVHNSTQASDLIHLLVITFLGSQSRIKSTGD